MVHVEARWNLPNNGENSDLQHNTRIILIFSSVLRPFESSQKRCQSIVPSQKPPVPFNSA